MKTLPEVKDTGSTLPAVKIVELKMESPEAIEARTGTEDPHTGIYVRAKDADGRWQSVDIATLDLESLRAWLRSRGGENEWAESTACMLLGHKLE